MIELANDLDGRAAERLAAVAKITSAPGGAETSNTPADQPRRRRRYPRPGDPTYDSTRARLRAERGAPAEHRCAGWDGTACATPAAVWSYDNADQREYTDRTTGCTYSPDLDHYLPRCRSCHRKADWAHRRRDRAPLDPAKVLLHYRDGVSLAAIARMFGYTSPDVRAFLDELGEPIRAHSAPIGRTRRGAEASSC